MASAEAVAPPTAALLAPKAAAAYLSMGRSTLDRLAAAGLVPAPVRVGGRPFWPREQLDHWAAVGCPPAAAFAPVWAARLAADAAPKRR